jgi:hypothetical protein
MSNFSKAMNAHSTTWNGALSYSSADSSGEYSARLALFFKAVRNLNIPTLYEYLRQSSQESLIDTFLLAFYIRDCRGGKGERNLGDYAFQWLLVNYPDDFARVYPLLPYYGRWDDVLNFFPGMLNLDELDNVRATFCSDWLSPETLERARTVRNDIVKLMATQLRKDRKNMLQGKPISICAKWTPTEKDSCDRNHGTFGTLAKVMNIHPKVLRKDFNTPLREYLKVVETYICSGRWEEVNYNKVPSLAMKNLRCAFVKHDEERYNEWKATLASGETKVNASQLYPHELIKQLRMGGYEKTLLEAQWKVLVENTEKLGTLTDTIVVVDTSSSMHVNKYLPLDVAISLGLLISEVVKGPFHNHLISFNTIPRFTVIKEGSIIHRYETVRNMDWGGSTNIEATFELILKRARQCKLDPADMPKRLMIISDMQFNSAVGNVTNFERIEQLYAQYGYVRPQIVFWNVQSKTADFPTTRDHNNTCMVSGFSPSILKSILSACDFSPVSILRETIDGERYAMVRERFVRPSVESSDVASSEVVNDLASDVNSDDYVMV